MKSNILTSFRLFSTYWKKSLIFVCLIALLSLTAGLLGSVFLSDNSPIEPIKLGIVNEDESNEAVLLIGFLESSLENVSSVQLKAFDDRKTAQDSMNANNISAIFILPEMFLQNVLSGHNNPIIGIYNTNFPIQTGLLKLFSDNLLEILKSSQAGIYTALTYVNEHQPEKNDEIYEKINRRYMNLALSHDKIISPKIITPVGKETSVFAHYLYSFILFLSTLTGCLYSPIISKKFTLNMRKNAFLSGLKPFSISIGWSIGLWFWINATIFIPFLIYCFFSILNFVKFSIFIPLTLIMFSFIISQVSCIFSFLFTDDSLSVFFILLFGIASLFMSGGIVPLPYLPEKIVFLSKFFPAFWGTELLKSTTKSGFNFSAFLILILFSIILTVINLGIVTLEKSGVRQ